jgi:3-hydroxyisobutyrate dehydrogenase
MCTTVLTATSIQVLRARSPGPGSSRSASRSNAVTTSSTAIDSCWPLIRAARCQTETLSFARRLDLDPAEIVDLLQSTPLWAPYAVQKARSMLTGDFSPAFALKHPLKDAELATQAAQDSGATLTLTSALLPRWRDTAASGHADDDLSAVYLAT